jgi:hypothetical protein
VLKEEVITAEGQGLETIKSKEVEFEFDEAYVIDPVQSVTFNE